MLNVSDIEAAAVTRMKTIIPAMSASILPDIDRPDQMSGQYLQKQHPRGLFIVRYDKSNGSERTEHIVINVVCVAYSARKTLDLCQAARIALIDFQPTGTTKFEFLSDEAEGNEAGIFVRNCSFSCATPAVPPGDRSAAIAALNL